MNRLRAIYSFDYMGHKYWWFAISATVILVGLAFMLVRGGGNPVDGLKWGIDFKGGTRIDVAFVKAVGTSQVRTVVAQQGQSDAIIQQVKTSGPGSTFQIQTRALDQAQGLALQQSLDKAFQIATTSTGNKDYSENTVGPAFGRQVVSASWKAAVVALILILIYITLRFEWKFAIGAIAAEIHDLLVVMSVYSLVGREVTTATLAAVLTILGYSLYDTIIVYDRIRENGPKMVRATYGDMVNRSIWETLTRSINTTLLVLFPVVSLVFFGGATLKDFAFALLVGIVSGAYSSIFVASPVLTLLKEREPQFRRTAGPRAARGSGKLARVAGDSSDDR